jgi:hypothetical protein
MTTMTALQAFLGICALAAVFIADRKIKSIANNNLVRTEPVTESIVLRNLQTVSLRNKRLANLALCAFAASFVVQLLSLLNATNNQNQKNMTDINDITTRVTKIERYIWGDGGVPTKPTQPNPPALSGRLEDIEKKLNNSQTVTSADANLALINKTILEMKAEIGELRELVKATKKPMRLRAHAH